LRLARGIDEYWAKLTAGGSAGQCGWLKDKFGLSLQIVPAHLPDFIRSPAAKQAMMKIKKLDIGVLERAAHSWFREDKYEQHGRTGSGNARQSRRKRLCVA
jgi:hypothetical protein